MTLSIFSGGGHLNITLLLIQYPKITTRHRTDDEGKVGELIWVFAPNSVEFLSEIFRVAGFDDDAELTVLRTVEEFEKPVFHSSISSTGLRVDSNAIIFAGTVRPSSSALKIAVLLSRGIKPIC